MLMSRTLGSLLLGLTTTVYGNIALLSGLSAHLALGDARIKGYGSLVDGKTTNHEAMGEIGQSGDSDTRPTSLARPYSVETTNRSRRPRRRRQNTEDAGSEIGSAQAVCQGRNGTTINCPEEIGCCMLPTGEAGCCPAAGVTCDEGDCVQATASIPSTAAATDLAIITVTQTTTSTFTSFAETRLAIVTSTQVLTFINPTQRTATSTITVTSFLRRAKRTFGSPVESTVAQTPHVPSPTSSPEPRITPIPRRKYMGTRAAAEKRQEATLTSTVVIRTTVLIPGITTRTLTNIVFSTTSVARNAATTVFITTTVFRPLSSSTATVPETTAPVDQSPVEPTPSSMTDSEATASLTPTDSAEPTDPTEPLPTDSPSLTSATPSASAPTTSTPSTDVTTATITTTLPPPETTTTTALMEPTEMETMSLSPTPTANPNLPPPTQQPTLTPAQIAALVLGIIFSLLLFIALAFLLRRAVIKRRQAQAKIRQHLDPPLPPLMSGGGGGNSSSSRPSAPAPIVPTGPSSSNNSSNSSAAYSGLTGEGEVRIVIRPAPKRRTQSSGVGGGGTSSIPSSWTTLPLLPVGKERKRKRKKNGVSPLKGGV
ncbi:hypothetical protein QBC41DRAFT_353886 [Cercophora samala]|uniref:Uncharacterized protein n=1 Tax=Cercophora samala TaxID=330535 RepID=A0AA39ZJ10_9PEZI|nr:hypothetical protein QBC41DRAFT_353886 [Cercophora samala]